MSCKCAKYEEDENRYYCSVSGSGCVYMSPDSKQCAKDFGEGPDADNESEKIEMKDKTINLCDTCKFEIPSCKATEEGVDFKFGHGLGNDNVYECKIYEPKNKEEI